MSAASLIASPLDRSERFRLRLGEDIRDAVDSYPATADPREVVLHAVLELAREDGGPYRRAVRLLAAGACLQTVGSEIQSVAEGMLAHAADLAGVR